MGETKAELVHHRVALFYECRAAEPLVGQGLLDTTFAQVAAASTGLAWIDPARLAADGQRSLAADKVWQYNPLTVSHDLHPAIRSILATAAEGGSAMSPGCYRLTDKARNLVTGLYVPVATSSAASAATPPSKSTRNRGFILNLGPKTAARIGVASHPDLMVYLIETAFFCFRTGIGIAVAEVEIDIPLHHPSPLTVLIEAAHLLSDERRQPLLSWKSEDTSSGAAPAASDSKKSRFHFSGLLQPLLTDAGYEVAGGRRIFSYTSAVTGSDLDAVQGREIAFRLSRHYNYAYAPQVVGTGTEIIEPFTNVVHAASLEGVASVITLPADVLPDNGMPEFLTNWFETAYRPAYLPIAIVAYHEHLALLDFAQSAAIDLDFDHLAQAQIAELQQLCHRFLAFRLRYRPAQVSFITMHNEFSNALRRALGVDLLSQKAAQDAIEAEMRLSRHMGELRAAADEAARLHSERHRKEVRVTERKRERRWAWHGTLVACLLAILAVLNFTEQMSETPAKFIRLGFVWSSLEADDQIKLVGLIIALICGIVGGYINWFRLRQGEAEDEVLEEAKKDQAMERGGKERRHAKETEKAV